MLAKDKTSGLTVERLKQVLHYDPASGDFVWVEKTTPTARICVGSVAGQIDSTGYVRIWLDGERYLAHRLAWLYMTGEWPTEMVDHRDIDKANNRWSNLRTATNSENKANGRTYKKRSDLPKGVRAAGGKFAAQIVHNYKHYSLGTYQTPEAAHAAYVSKATELHGAFSRAA